MDDPNNPSIPASNAFPMPGPITTSTTTPTTPDLSPVLPMAPEVEWPGSKPKSKLPQILGGIAAIILVVSVATAAYFVSNRISGRQAVAPTAPESEPLAADACKGKCSAKEYCDDGRCRKKPDPAPPYSCNATNCPAPDFRCSSDTNCVRVNNPPPPDPVEPPTNLQCASGYSCKASPSSSDKCNATCLISAGVSGSCCKSNSACTEGATSCADNHKYVCQGGKWTAAGPCVTATGIPIPTTTQPIGGPIVTPKPTKKPGNNPEEPPETSCIEQCPGSDGVLRSCTPPEADGSSNDSLCNLAGRVESCGGKKFCCPKPGGKWTTNMTNCSTTITPTPIAGACMEVALYAKICPPGAPGEVTCMAEGYQTTPMTAAQRARLRVGDKIRIAITGNKANLKARFRVLIDDVVETPEWKLGQGYSGADKKTMWYSDYEIKSAGNYKFEGQVTTEP